MLVDIHRATDAEFQGYAALWGETDFVGWASAHRFWGRPSWWAKAHPTVLYSTPNCDRAIFKAENNNNAGKSI